MSANAGERSENAGALAERSASAPPPRVQEASRDEEGVGEEDALPPPPLPREDPTPPGALPRISWRRAVGIFHLYLAWLIADAVGLCVSFPAAHPTFARRAVRDPWTPPTFFFCEKKKTFFKMTVFFFLLRRESRRSPRKKLVVAPARAVLTSARLTPPSLPSLLPPPAPPFINPFFLF